MHFLEEKPCTVRTIQYRIPTIKKNLGTYYCCAKCA